MTVMANRCDDDFELYLPPLCKDACHACQEGALADKVFTYLFIIGGRVATFSYFLAPKTVAELE
jgi:hypothetical protein